MEIKITSLKAIKTLCNEAFQAHLDTKDLVHKSKV
jgi:hypothetical protein